jgi:hypothetical protein
MEEPPDISPSLTLADIVGRVKGTVLVRRPSVSLLKNIGLYAYDPGRRVVAFFEEKGEARAFGRRLARGRVKGVQILLGDLPHFAPMRRRGAAAVVTKHPQTQESEDLRFLRKAAGLLADDGLLVLLARVRGRISGSAEHAARLLFTSSAGLPDETGLASLLLRGGFSRIQKFKPGRLRRRTFFLARKNTL